MKKMNGSVLEIEEEPCGGKELTQVCDIRRALRDWERRQGLSPEYGFAQQIRSEVARRKRRKR